VKTGPKSIFASTNWPTETYIAYLDTRMHRGMVISDVLGMQVNNLKLICFVSNYIVYVFLYSQPNKNLDKINIYGGLE
jgi:hypothetical protein